MGLPTAPRLDTIIEEIELTIAKRYEWLVRSDPDEGYYAAIYDHEELHYNNEEGNTFATMEPSPEAALAAALAAYKAYWSNRP